MVLDSPLSWHPQFSPGRVKSQNESSTGAPSNLAPDTNDVFATARGHREIGGHNGISAKMTYPDHHSAHHLKY